MAATIYIGIGVALCVCAGVAAILPLRTRARITLALALGTAAVVAFVIGGTRGRNQSGAGGPRLPTVCVVQYDNRSPDELGELSMLMHETKVRCEQDSTCRYVDKSSDQSLLGVPGYWAKVYASLLVAKTHSECDWVMWLDTDAHLTGLKLLGEYIAENTTPEQYFVYSDDGPWGKAHFNAGVWFASTNDKGVSLLDEWSTVFSDSANRCWTRGATGRWKCNTEAPGCSLDCEWASSAFEQGAMLTILRRPVHRGGKRQVQSCDIMHDSTARSVQCRGRTAVARHFVHKKFIPHRNAQSVITASTFEALVHQATQSN